MHITRSFLVIFIYPAIRVTFIDFKDQSHFLYHYPAIFTKQCYIITKPWTVITNPFKQKFSIIYFCFGKIIVFLLSKQSIGLTCNFT